MKVGDLVKAEYSEAVGIVVDIIQKKVWRTEKHGKNVDWSKIDPEQHAVVLYSHNDGTVNIPFTDLEVISESLTDEQLEDVRGGMSHQTFSEWRAGKMNEDR